MNCNLNIDRKWSKNNEEYYTALTTDIKKLFKEKDQNAELQNVISQCRIMPRLTSRLAVGYIQTLRSNSILYKEIVSDVILRLQKKDEYSNAYDEDITHGYIPD